MTLIGHGQTLSDISTEPAGPTWQVAQSVKVTDLPDGTLVSPYGEKVVSFNNLPMNARQILGYRGFVQNDATGERLPFEDGALIHAKNKKAGIPVKVWGPDPRCEAEYPSAIVITDPRIMEAMRQMMEGPGPKIFYRFRYTPEFLESFRNSPPRINWDPPPKAPRPRPILVEGENGKKITLDNAGEFFKFTVDPDVVTLAFADLGVRLNHSFEVIDAAGQIYESIDAKARTGDLGALWKFVRTDMARLEMDAGSFRIDFQDGSIVRSLNQLDVRQPDLEQVDFWQPADDSYNSPMPKDP